MAGRQRRCPCGRRKADVDPCGRVRPARGRCPCACSAGCPHRTWCQDRSPRATSAGRRGSGLCRIGGRGPQVHAQPLVCGSARVVCGCRIAGRRGRRRDVALPRQPPDTGGGVLSEDGGGTYTASGPWRLEIHDKIEVSDNGCSVTMTKDGSNLSWQQEGVYGIRAFQLPYTGTFRWRVNDPGCVIIPRATPGQVELPFTWAAYTGDTDAFHVPAAFTADVRNWEGDECELVLKEPSDGTTVDIGNATRANPSVRLDPGGRSEVYLADLSCDVRVSE